MHRLRIRWDLDRLERPFLLLTAAVLLLVGLTLYGAISYALTRQALQTAAWEANADNTALAPLFLGLPRAATLPPEKRAEIDQVVAREGSQRYALVKIWTPEGNVLYSTERELIGQHFNLQGNDGLRHALQGEVAADFSDLSKPENDDERQLGFSHLLEVYTPLRDGNGQVVGAFEIYRDGELVASHIRSLRMILVGGLMPALLLIWGALYSLIHQAGVSLRQRNEALHAAEHARQATLRGALTALSDAVEAKDAYTGGHIERVSEYAHAIAVALGVTGEELRAIEFGALLHDIGKLGIPDNILLKPGPLDADERRIMETHAAKGQHILRSVPALDSLGQIVRHHHERWDGKGYPDGLEGESIPVGARVIAVVDTYDAITTDRPYRAGRSHEVAVAELQRVSGSQFDPRVVAALVALPRRLDTLVTSPPLNHVARSATV